MGEGMIAKKLACVAAAALATAAAAPASAATFIGDNVTIKRIQGGTNVFKTVNTTVGATPEYLDNFFSIDITANQVLFKAAGGSFSIGDIVYEVSGLDFDDNPATANIIEGFSATQIFTGINTPLGMDRATITPAGVFRMNFANARGGASGLASITFGAAPLSGAVPEPATWAMMIGGFGLVGGAMRSARRRRGAELAYSR
jgi:hypothetical protein